MAQKLLPCIFGVILFNSSCSASVLSWLTGGTTDPLISPNTDSSLPSSPYPDETGECAHWGNQELPHISSSDLTYSSGGFPVAGPLIGSHKGVPVGSVVTVTNMRNGNTIKIRVVPPRTPPVAGRVMELSPAAFSQLGMLSDAVILCTVKVIQTPTGSQILSLTSHTFDNGGMGSIRRPAFPSAPTLVSTGSIPSLRDSFARDPYGYENGY